MTSDEVRLVLASWTSATDPRRLVPFEVLVGAHLGGRVDRAAWPVEVADELVHLLRSPAALGDRARELAGDPRAVGDDPTFARDGRALLAALRAVTDPWTRSVEQAWFRAWDLLAEEVALEHLSPFRRGT